MKMKISIITLAMVSCLWASHSFAAAITQAGGAGTAVTTGASASGGALVFSPSPSVLMGGQSLATAFAVVGGHSQAVGTADGKAYGLASDSSATYYTALTATTVSSFAGTTSAAFANWDTF